MKVQGFAFAGTGVGDLIFDLVGRDRLVTQSTLITLPVPSIDGGREHDDRQSTILDALDRARA
jgi:hypothetical protein